MDDLLRTRAKTAEAAARKGRRKRKKKNVSYSPNGKVKRGATPLWLKILIGFFCLIAAAALAIYVPPLFYKPASENSYVPIMPSATAIKTYQTYLKDSPDLDFDEDGMNNALEGDHGTDVWNVDTDGDGVSDYAELFVTQTPPKEAGDVMIKQIADYDEKQGANLGTPYKLDDIVFWPDTYRAKAYGATVKIRQTDTSIAYRFCYFVGWVKFPYETAKAYGYKNGIHYELKYRAAENAYKIENSDEVRLYASPLKFVHCLNLPFIGTKYLEDGGFGDFLTKILPDEGGPVTCRRKATIDVDPQVERDVTAPLRQPFYNKDDPARFGKNMNSLKDLSWLRKVIEAGHCVSVSLYSGNSGESIGIIYGYDENGDLLVANESLEPVGKITVIPMAMRMMDKEGTLGFRSWFEWRGLGFDSIRYRDRISFFASTLTDAESGSIEVSEQDVGVVGAGTETPQAQPQTQAQAPQTEVQTEPPQVQTQAQVQTEEPKPETQATEETETEAKDSVITFGL